MRHFCKHGVLSGRLRVLRDSRPMTGTAQSTRAVLQTARADNGAARRHFHRISIGIDRRVVIAVLSLSLAPERFGRILR